MSDEPQEQDENQENTDQEELPQETADDTDVNKEDNASDAAAPTEADADSELQAGSDADQAAEEIADDKLRKIMEAIIFYSRKPISLRKLSANIKEVPTERIRAALDAMVKEYDENHGIKLSQIAGGYMFLTDPDCAEWIKRFENRETNVKLSNAALETLAIIAFKQPITRAEVEAIRGVGCLPVINGLVEKKLVTIKGRSSELGAPLLYGTTKEFLEFFGLHSVKDLPAPDEL